MARAVTAKRTRRSLQAILVQIERVRKLCDRIENAVWDAVGAPKKRRPH